MIMTNNEYSYTEYHKSVASYAKEISERSKEENAKISDLIHEATDGSSWVFMYYGAKQTIEHSQNSDAYADNDIDLDASQGFNSICSQVAYWALYTDISEALEID